MIGLRYGLHVPNMGEYADAARLAGLAREAEDVGWDGFFLWDHVLYWNAGNLPLVDPWVALAAVAVETSRIRLGPLVTAVARRRPWKLARETVSLDHLSGGRLILGVGLGHPPEDDFAQFGEDADARVRAPKLDEGLDILVGLWSGEPFAYDGQYYHVQPTTFLPRPAQSPRIPIWVAGYLPHRAPFRRAARWDGVVPGGSKWDDSPVTPDELRRLLVEIGEWRSDYGTGAGRFDVVFGGETPGDDPLRAAETVAPWSAAGATWWLEELGPERGSFADMHARISAGPPRLSGASG